MSWNLPEILTSETNCSRRIEENSCRTFTVDHSERYEGIVRRQYIDGYRAGFNSNTECNFSNKTFRSRSFRSVVLNFFLRSERRRPLFLRHGAVVARRSRARAFRPRGECLMNG